MGKNIDEVIADAMAEEEVRADQPKNDYEECIKPVADIFGGCDNKVVINLAEYTALKLKEADLTRIVCTIASNLELSYSKEDLRIGDGDRIVNAFRALYTEVYDTILEDEKAKDAKQED